MGRPPTPLGHWGKITITPYYRDPASGEWVKGERPVRTLPARYTARARVRGQDGVVVPMQRDGRTKSTAEEALVKAMRAYARPEGGGAVQGGTTMNDLAKAWLAEVAAGDVQPSTISTYGYNVAAYITPRLGGLRVREVTVPTVDRWLREVTTQNGAANAKTMRTCLRGMFALAVRHGAITANPVREAAPIKRQEPKRPPRALTRAEEERLRTYLATDPTSCSLGLDDLMTFTLGTGARIGEALALTWAKVDFTPGREAVAITATGEWVKGGSRVKERTKTGASGNRVVPLTPMVADMLRVRRDTQPANEAGLVFPSVRGTLADRSNTLKRLRRALDACDLPDVTSHAARKTRATRLRDSGQVSDREVADLLGHADLRTTLSSYIGRQEITRASAGVE